MKKRISRVFLMAAFLFCCLAIYRDDSLHKFDPLHNPWFWCEITFLVVGMCIRPIERLK